MPIESVMDSVLLAHASHYALYVLYGVPVLVVLGSIGITLWRDRRSRDVNRSPTP